MAFPLWAIAPIAIVIVTLWLAGNLVFALEVNQKLWWMDKVPCTRWLHKLLVLRTHKGIRTAAAEEAKYTEGCKQLAAEYAKEANGSVEATLGASRSEVAEQQRSYLARTAGVRASYARSQALFNRQQSRIGEAAACFQIELIFRVRQGVAWRSSLSLPS